MNGFQTVQAIAEQEGRKAVQIKLSTIVYIIDNVFVNKKVRNI